jgi:hypothetical protein
LKSKLEYLKKRNKFLEHSGKRKKEKKDEEEKKAAHEKAVSEFESKVLEVCYSVLELDVYKVILKIVRNVKNKDKCAKCIDMLVKLVKNSIVQIESNTLFTILDFIIKCPHILSTQNTRNALLELYSFIIQYSQYSGGIFTPQQEVNLLFILFF